MIDIMLQAARTELLQVSENLDIARKCGFPQETPIRQLGQALDRVWELQCMDKMVGSVNAAKAARIIPLCSSQSLDLPNPFSEVAR
jgi:hypothetical protein